jgi:ABC-2 type transport system permease protein
MNGDDRPGAPATPVPLDLTARPGPAPRRRRVLAQSRLELATAVRNGEQLLLMVLIPIGLLLFLTWVPVGGRPPVGSPRVDVVVPGIMALAVMSTAFTSLAVQTGFERRYGVLKRLGTTPVTAGDLLLAKALVVGLVELAQLLLITVVAVALGWRPTGLSVGGAVGVPVILLVGTAAFVALALLLAGTLRAEATLAVANLVYLVLLLLGGIVVPLSSFPPGLAHVLHLLPSAALAEGLRHCLGVGMASGFPVAGCAVLTGWAVVAGSVAARTFRWE